MFRIGCHISAAGGYLAMGKKAAALGANTFAFFTRNPRGGASKALDEKDVASFLDYAAERDIAALVAHAPYTLNPCAEKENVREFARLAFREDLQRMEYTPGQCYNFHPGSHVGQGVAVGIEKITEILNESLFPEMRTTVLLETMAGKGSEVGGRFEELRAILDGVALKDIQEWLGHSDIATTSNIYTHLDYSSKVASANAIMGVFQGSTATERILPTSESTSESPETPVTTGEMKDGKF